MRFFRSNRSFSVFRLKSSAAIIAVVWITGLIGGINFVSVAGEPFCLLMYESAFCRVSIVGLLAVLYLPLLLSVVVVRLSVPALQYAICLLKAFFFGCCLNCSSYAFGTASWLVLLLLLFSDCSMTVPLLLFWFRHISGSRILLRRDLFCCCFFAAVIGVLDYFIISPYLVNIMHYL